MFYGESHTNLSMAQLKTTPFERLVESNNRW